MTEFERFAAALALTESDNDQKAWGDQGLAVGRWQMHPAFVDEYWKDEIEVGWSWDHLFHAALLRFYNTRFIQGVTLSTVVMEFHLGAEAVRKGHWDSAYWERFRKYYDAPYPNFGV